MDAVTPLLLTTIVPATLMVLSNDRTKAASRLKPLSKVTWVGELGTCDAVPPPLPELPGGMGSNVGPVPSLERVRVNGWLVLL